MKQGYIPYFPEMIRFAQLRHLLLRRDEAGASVVYQVKGARYQLTIKESTRYTTLVEIRQMAPVVSYWSLPFMPVRLYHDAMVAEVCSTQQIYRFKARYDYPNKKNYISATRNIRSTSSFLTGCATA